MPCPGELERIVNVVEQTIRLDFDPTQPANPEMDPIYLAHDEIEILGIVTGVVRLSA
jgi:SOS-response transcriptional repressor LexA